jgi:predicted DsbA family dithiol-disulfide isomerase
MRIEVWSDIVCPWCYIGKRRFERALAGFDHRDAVRVVYHSFQLDPVSPPGEVRNNRDNLMSKYGMSQAQADAAQIAMERTAADEGLEFHLVGGVTGNTFDAHRVLHLAAARDRQDIAVERFFRAHFTEQRSIFDRDSLTTISAESGLDAEEVRDVLGRGTYADEVRADNEQARALGASGVPFFVLDGRYAVSGAQTPEVFAQALLRAWADRPQTSTAEP